MSEETKQKIKHALRILNQEERPLQKGEIWTVKFAVEIALKYGLKQDDKGVWYAPE